MRVSDSSRVLFVHVPKTGGSTIDSFFDREVPDARRVEGKARHAPYGRLLSAEPGLEDYWSFGFARNPWARMVSWWTMVHSVFTRAAAGEERAVAKIERHPSAWLPEGEFKDSFDRFVLEGTEKIAKVGRPQIASLSAGARQVDFVGRTEDFAAGVAVVRERLGLPQLEKIPRRNKTSHGHYSEYFNAETRRKVAEVFAADIDAFGYTYEDRT